MASVYWHAERMDRTLVTAEATRIDERADLASERVRFVKIDVEGAEGDAIQGMRSTIERCRPVIFIECSDIGRHATWGELTSLGYRCLRARDLTENVSEFQAYRHDDFLWLP